MPPSTPSNINNVPFVPPGYTVGTMGPNKEKYIMPQYMVPAYTHSWMVSGPPPPGQKPAAYDNLPSNEVRFPVETRLNRAELIIIHRWIKSIQERDSITYDEACKRLYAEQNERLLCADEDAKAWSDLNIQLKSTLAEITARKNEDAERDGTHGRTAARK